MQNLEELLRKAEEIRQEVRVGGNTAQRVGLVLVQLVDTAQALLAQIQEEERLRQETDASIKKDINTLDEKVEDLPSPVAPLSNNNGLLELKYDTDSLYVQDGKLCARLPEADPSEPVPGAGVIYSEGAGISIDDENIISVRIDKSLELNNNGAIRVGTGEGLIHNKEGRLSINIGKGLSLEEYSNKIVLEDNDYIKSLPSLFEKKQDVIEAGNGLEKVGNLLKVEDTLVNDVIKSKQHISSLQVEINQQSIQISSKQDKLSEGLGIIISDNNEISVNGNVLSVMHANNASNDASGRSISGTYATQEEVGSVVRSLAGVETRVDANAAAIEELRIKEEIIFGDGLSHVDNVVEVDSNIISGIADNAREIGSLKIGKQDRLTQGSGIEITSENVINVDGSNLQVLLSTNAINDEDGNRIRATYAKKEEVGGIYEAIEATNTTVASHTQSIESLELNKQDNLDFGNGLETVGSLVKVEDAVLKDIADNKADINALGTTVETLSSSISGKQDKLTASDGINLDDGKLSVHIGTGLDFDPESSAVVVKVGAGIKTDINQSLTIKHDATLTTDADGQLGVNQGTITSIAASEVAKVVANAPANYDTLKEIADYIATDAEGAAQLSNRIGALESALPNKMDTIAFGSGLAVSSNVVKVADAVMTDIANNKSNIGKLQSSVDGLSTSKQDTISDLATIRSNAANGATAYGWGYHGIAGYAKKAKVNGSTYESDSNGVINLPAYPTTLPASDVYAWAKASSKPSYSWSEINNKPTIPSAVTESTVSGWGFTKNTGTYSKPSGGIPKSDLNSSVQTSLSNADAAYGWGDHSKGGYAKQARLHNKNIPTDASGTIILPDYPTSLPANGGNADTVGGLTAKEVAFFGNSISPYYNSTGWLKFMTVDTAAHDEGMVDFIISSAVVGNRGVSDYYHFETRPADKTYQFTVTHLGTGSAIFSDFLYAYTTDYRHWDFYIHYTANTWAKWGRVKPISCRNTAISCVNTFDTTTPTGTSIRPTLGGYVNSADKLSTPRSIWGQSFDGSGDISGAMQNVGSIHFGNQPYGGRGIYQGNWYLGDLTEQDIAFNFIKTYFEGNVGIGTTDPQAPLDVNGSVRTKGINVTEGGIYWPAETSATWETFGKNANCGLKILNTIGQLSTGAPNDYAVGLSVSGYYGFCLAYYGGGKTFWLKGNGDNGWERIIHTGNLSDYFTDGFEKVNDTIKISTSYIAESLKGDGLVLDESGKMSVDSANLSVKSADTAKYLNLKCVTNLDDAEDNSFFDSGFQATNTPATNYTVGFVLKNRTLGYSYQFALDAQRRPHIRRRYGDVWQEWTSLAFTSDIPASLPANGGNADTLDGHDSSYFATKTELGNKQDTLAFGSGIAHSNNTIWVDGSQLNVNYANSAGSVAWGNVSGRPSFGNGFDSTNNVVQLKLSTGLAIDDRGYLYVTGL